MIYTFEEYKEAAVVAESYEFAKRYAVANSEEAKRILKIHRLFEKNMEDEEFCLAMYKDYLNVYGIC